MKAIYFKTKQIFILSFFLFCFLTRFLICINCLLMYIYSYNTDADEFKFPIILLALFLTNRQKPRPKLILHIQLPSLVFNYAIIVIKL